MKSGSEMETHQNNVANDLKNDEISCRRLGYENHFAEIKKG